ncbi:MAG: M14 family metallopeptidase [Candidatus Methylumidiphilus sp.]
MLNILDRLPDGFLDTPAQRLHERLPGPTLIHLPGRRAEPLFVSILLHGNEDTGMQAMRQLLAQYRDKPLPRSLSLFVGNVAAARVGLRRLDGQPDYNRVWPGCVPQGWPEERLMAEVTETMRARGVFASIDLHNNTGLNPHYACIDRLNLPTLRLATLFSRIVVQFLRPLGVQSMAFAEFCPAVTVECGKTGDHSATAHAAAFVEAALRLDHFPTHPLARHDIDLYRAVAIVNVAETARIAFGDGAAGAKADVMFDAELDRFNFTDLPAATCLGRARPHRPLPLQAINDDGQDIAAHYFAVDDTGLLLTRRPLMPAMLTRDAAIIRQDCLCYLMERLPWV